MGALAAGSVVLVRFPFSDLSGAKLRPAVVLARVGRDDLVLCQITSSTGSDPSAIRLDAMDFAVGSLHRVSYARPGKLFTADGRIASRRVGALRHPVRQTIVEALIRLLRPSG